MNKKIFVLAVLVLSVFLAGCASNQAGYSTYNQQQQGQQPYVGGGCGVAPSGAYEDTPIGSFDSAGASL
ncbi:hypothetical protein HY487_01575 [Candidatus Woesearchaeota archaeon]|nr:hypothetical protein [Candidatus Woesearchaeota archaeon]